MGHSPELFVLIMKVKLFPVFTKISNLCLLSANLGVMAGAVLCVPYTWTQFIFTIPPGGWYCYHCDFTNKHNEMLEVITGLIHRVRTRVCVLANTDVIILSLWNIFPYAYDSSRFILSWFTLTTKQEPVWGTWFYTLNQWELKHQTEKTINQRAAY